MVETSENVDYNVLYKNATLKTTYSFINQKWGKLDIKKGQILTTLYTTRKLYYFGAYHVPNISFSLPSSFLSISLNRSQRELSYIMNV